MDSDGKRQVTLDEIFEKQWLQIVLWKIEAVLPHLSPDCYVEEEELAEELTRLRAMAFWQLGHAGADQVHFKLNELPALAEQLEHTLKVARGEGTTTEEESEAGEESESSSSSSTPPRKVKKKIMKVHMT